MSSARLLFSGSLVASGLILGAFTLHGTFDHRTGRQGPQPQAEPKAINAFQTRTQVAPVERVAQDAIPQPALVKSEARPEPKAADAMSPEAKAARAEARRKLAEKRKAEKAEKEKAEREKLAKQQSPPQQATLQWPWNWFGN
jgi:hypothetical protein